MTFNIFSKPPQLTAELFRRNRRYFYLIVLIIGACFTDSPSGKEQLTIAIPLMLAFEWAIALIDKR